jgi:hypothetical protein
MRSSAFELIIEGSPFMQYAVENIGRDSSCREAGYLGWLREFQWRHGIVTSQQEFDDDSAGIGAVHRGGIGFLAREYAKCKNRSYILKAQSRTVTLR